jgi:hypothetical protein
MLLSLEWHIRGILPRPGRPVDRPKRFVGSMVTLMPNFLNKEGEERFRYRTTLGLSHSL